MTNGSISTPLIVTSRDLAVDVDVGQLDTAHPDAVQVDITELRVGQVDLPELRALEVDVVEPGAAEVLAGEVSHGGTVTPRADNTVATAHP